MANRSGDTSGMSNANERTLRTLGETIRPEIRQSNAFLAWDFGVDSTGVGPTIQPQRQIIRPAIFQVPQ
jgi:hypothetical protein